MAINQWHEYRDPEEVDIEDALLLYKQAMARNQPGLAMEYLMRLVEFLLEENKAIREELDSSSKAASTPKKQSKTTKKTAASATKTKEESEDSE